jgi:hypothetical protein
MSDYGMYTVDGEMKVNLLVSIAREKMWDWAKVERELAILAESNPDCSEAFDTEVRESVYVTLGFKTPFYG